MKRPTFLEGVGVAIAASLAGSVLYTAMDVVFPGGPVLRLLIAGIGLAYVIYLLSRSPEHVGRITATAAWALVAGVLWFTEPPLLPCTRGVKPGPLPACNGTRPRISGSPKVVWPSPPGSPDRRRSRRRGR